MNKEQLRKEFVECYNAGAYYALNPELHPQYKREDFITTRLAALDDLIYTPIEPLDPTLPQATSKRVDDGDDKESEISVEQLYAVGWVRKMDDTVFPIEKKIGNRNPLNASDDTNIEFVVHGMYNSSQFAIQFPDGGLLNFNPRSLEDLKAFERMISFYDAPF